MYSFCRRLSISLAGYSRRVIELMVRPSGYNPWKVWCQQVFFFFWTSTCVSPAVERLMQASGVASVVWIGPSGAPGAVRVWVGRMPRI